MALLPSHLLESCCSHTSIQTLVGKNSIPPAEAELNASHPQQKAISDSRPVWSRIAWKSVFRFYMMFLAHFQDCFMEALWRQWQHAIRYLLTQHTAPNPSATHTCPVRTEPYLPAAGTLPSTPYSPTACSPAKLTKLGNPSPVAVTLSASRHKAPSTVCLLLQNRLILTMEHKPNYLRASYIQESRSDSQQCWTPFTSEVTVVLSLLSAVASFDKAHSACLWHTHSHAVLFVQTDPWSWRSFLALVILWFDVLHTVCAFRN